MRFLNCTSGAKVPSKSLLDAGADNAINACGFNEQIFLKRGGKYTWSKADISQRSLAFQSVSQGAKNERASCEK